MTTKYDLDEWIVTSLRARRGRARLVDVCRDDWAEHETELRALGDLSFSWQYDIRWVALRLRDAGLLTRAGDNLLGMIGRAKAAYFVGAEVMLGDQRQRRRPASNRVPIFQIEDCR